MEKLILPGLRSSLLCKILLYVSTRIVHRSFPADFDGDCVPIYYPHTLTAKTKALELFSVEKQLISSHNGTINLYHSYTIPCIWLTSSLSIFLKILVHALSRYPSFSECHTRKFLLEICSLVVLLVTTGSTMIETSESLLWTTNTRFYHLARAGIAWASFNSVSIDRLGIYISDPKSSKSFFWSCEENNLRRNWWWM